MSNVIVYQFLESFLSIYVSHGVAPLVLISDRPHLGCTLTENWYQHAVVSTDEIGHDASVLKWLHANNCPISEDSGFCVKMIIQSG